MTDVLIRPATLQDAADLAPRLRDADLIELALSSLLPIADILMDSIRRSEEAWVGELDGKVIAIGGFGIAKGTDIGCPWLVGSPEVLKHPLKLTRIGRQMVSRWSSRCSLMTNFTLQGNELHISWLKRIGFEVGAPTLYGPFKAPFVQFYRKT